MQPLNPEPLLWQGQGSGFRGLGFRVSWMNKPFPCVSGSLLFLPYPSGSASINGTDIGPESL